LRNKVPYTSDICLFVIGIDKDEVIFFRGTLELDALLIFFFGMNLSLFFVLFAITRSVRATCDFSSAC
jgi:hypothetical protein